MPWACSMRWATSAPLRPVGTSDYFSKRLLSLAWTTMDRTITAIITIQIIEDVIRAQFLQKYTFYGKKSADIAKFAHYFDRKT